MKAARGPEDGYCMRVLALVQDGQEASQVQLDMAVEEARQLREAAQAALDLLGKGRGMVDCGVGSEARIVARMLRDALGGR